MTTDTERLDYLERLFRQGGRIVLRKSTMGRGFRLHNCKPDEWKPNCLLVREAIDFHMKESESNDNS